MQILGDHFHKDFGSFYYRLLTVKFAVRNSDRIPLRVKSSSTKSRMTILRPCWPLAWCTFSHSSDLFMVAISHRSSVESTLATSVRHDGVNTICETYKLLGGRPLIRLKSNCSNNCSLSKNRYTNICVTKWKFVSNFSSPFYVKQKNWKLVIPIWSVCKPFDPYFEVSKFSVS